MSAVGRIRPPHAIMRAAWPHHAAKHAARGADVPLETARRWVTGGRQPPGWAVLRLMAACERFRAEVLRDVTEGGAEGGVGDLRAATGRDVVLVAGGALGEAGSPLPAASRGDARAAGRHRARAGGEGLSGGYQTPLPLPADDLRAPGPVEQRAHGAPSLSTPGLRLTEPANSTGEGSTPSPVLFRGA